TSARSRLRPWYPVHAGRRLCAPPAGGAWLLAVSHAVRPRRGQRVEADARAAGRGDRLFRAATVTAALTQRRGDWRPQPGGSGFCLSAAPVARADGAQEPLGGTVPGLLLLLS